MNEPRALTGGAGSEVVTWLVGRTPLYLDTPTSPHVYIADPPALTDGLFGALIGLTALLALVVHLSRDAS